MDVTQLMEGLDLKEVLLAFPEKLNTLFVTLNHHVGEYLVSLPLLLNLSIFDFYNSIAGLLLFFFLKRISFNSELGVELSAGLKRLIAVVSVTLDVFKKFLRSFLV
jgi:hypothetical protein